MMTTLIRGKFFISDLIVLGHVRARILGFIHVLFKSTSRSDLFYSDLAYFV